MDQELTNQVNELFTKSLKKLVESVDKNVISVTDSHLVASNLTIANQLALLNKNVTSLCNILADRA